MTKKLTEEHKQRIAAALRGRKHTAERKQHVSEATKAAMARPEIQAKLKKPRPNGSLAKLGPRNPMYGKAVSEETRAKHRASMLGKHAGEKNPAYKGEAASLGAIHTWLRRRYPLVGKCSRCGEERYTERAFLRWPKQYTRNPDDFAEMCRPCHTKFDISTGERPDNFPNHSEDWFARCRMCGAQWPIPQWHQPRKCSNAECEAGWLDIAMWRSEAEATAMVPDGGFSWPSQQ